MYRYKFEIAVKSNASLLATLEKYLDLFITMLGLAGVIVHGGIVYIEQEENKNGKEIIS